MSDDNRTYLYIALAWFIMNMIQRWIKKKRAQSVKKEKPVKPLPGESTGGSEEIYDLDLDSTDYSPEEVSSDDALILQQRINNLSDRIEDLYSRSRRDNILVPVAPLFESYLYSSFSDLKEILEKPVRELDLNRDEYEDLSDRTGRMESLADYFSELFMLRSRTAGSDSVTGIEPLYKSLSDVLARSLFRGQDGSYIKSFVPVVTEDWVQRDFFPAAWEHAIVFIPQKAVSEPSFWPLNIWSIGNSLWHSEKDLRKSILELKNTYSPLKSRSAYANLADYFNLDYIFSRWTGTFWVDAFSIAALGPSFVRSFFEYQTSSGSDTPESDYPEIDKRPPFELRASTMLGILRHMGYDDEADEIISAYGRNTLEPEHITLPVMDGSLVRFPFEPLSSVCVQTGTALIEMPVSVADDLPLYAWNGFTGKKSHPDKKETLHRDLMEGTVTGLNPLRLIAAAAEASLDHPSRSGIIRRNALKSLQPKAFPRKRTVDSGRRSVRQLFSDPLVLRDAILTDAVFLTPGRRRLH